MPTIYAPSRRLFERASSLMLAGFIVWPLITGKMMQSTGHEYLLRIGLNLGHISLALGLLGFARLGLVLYHGNLFGICPWARGVLAAMAAVVWGQLFLSVLGASLTDPFTSAGVPLYSALFYGEIVTVWRAFRDAKVMMHLRRWGRENGSP